MLFNSNLVILTASLFGLMFGSLPGARAGCGGSRRYLLATDMESDVSNNQCKQAEYEAFIAIHESHMSFYARPIATTSASDSTLPSCDSYDFHLMDPAHKEVLKIEINKEFEDDEALYPLGSYTLETLMDAYFFSSTNSNKYDVVTNNCASILLEMFCQLGVETSKEMLDWVAEQLIATGHDKIFDLMKDSDHLDLLGIETGEYGRILVNEDVNTLVNYYVNNFQCPAMGAPEKDDENPKNESGATFYKTITASFLATTGAVVWMILS